MALRILFLDDDPVIRVLRMVLSDAEHDPWIRDYFAPEKVDPSRLVKAAKPWISWAIRLDKNTAEQSGAT